MKYYYCETTKALIPLENIIKSKELPVSVRNLTEKISEYIDSTEHLYTGHVNKPIIYDDVFEEKIAIFFLKMDRYRRGSVYAGIQISFNHLVGYDISPFSNPYKKCNVAVKIYCTDTINHSSTAFGTTPSIRECKEALKYYQDNKEIFHEAVYKTFYFFCDN
jgi:hypothetical protein